MKPIVLQLQEEALNPDVSISDLLRKAYVVARKLKISEMKAWIDSELNGYTSGKCPEYRKVIGQLKAFSPYRGWIPIVCADPETAKALSERYIIQPIDQLDSLCTNRDETTLHIPLPQDIQLKLMKVNQSDFESALLFDKSQISSVLSSVRNIVLEWSLKLEEKNILGEGMSFSNKEIQEAQIASNLIIHNFQGMLGNVKDSQVTQYNTMQIEKHDFPALAKYLRSIGVEEPDVKELEASISTDPEPTKKGEFGQKVNQWVGKMISKAAGGGWEIAINTVAGILTQALLKFYGF